MKERNQYQNNLQQQLPMLDSSNKCNGIYYLNLKMIKRVISILRRSLFLNSLLLLSGCIGNWNPNHTPKKNYPYFIATEPIIVKKIMIPKGTKVVYQNQFLKKGKQKKMMREESIISIELPNGQTINWGGAPVRAIRKFYNAKMRGFTVHPNFNTVHDYQTTELFQLWKSHGCNLGITVNETDDWSCNPKNISNVESCGVNYQRYFKEDKDQQAVLDNLYTELMKVDEK